MKCVNALLKLIFEANAGKVLLRSYFGVGVKSVWGKVLA